MNILEPETLSSVAQVDARNDSSASPVANREHRFVKCDRQGYSIHQFAISAANEFAVRLWFFSHAARAGWDKFVWIASKKIQCVLEPINSNCSLRARTQPKNGNVLATGGELPSKTTDF